MDSLSRMAWWLAHGEFLKQGLTVCPECKQPISLEGPDKLKEGERD